MTAKNKSWILKSRKAQLGTLVKIILVLVVAILLITSIVIIYSKLGAKGDIEVCRISVLAQAETKLGIPTVATSPFSIECKKRYVNFYSNRVEIGNSPDATKAVEVNFNGRLTKKIPELSDYVVNQVIAEEMRICNYEFGEGQTNIFNQEFFKFNGDVCFVCSEISFKDQTPHLYSGFMDYVNKTFIKNEGVTYYDYFNKPSLSSFKWSGGIYRFTQNGNIEFDSKNPYYVIFIKEDKKWSAWVKDVNKYPILLATPTLLIAIASWKAAGDVQNNYHTYVVNKDQLNSACELEAS